MVLVVRKYSPFSSPSDSPYPPPPPRARARAPLMIRFALNNLAVLEFVW